MGFHFSASKMMGVIEKAAFFLAACQVLSEAAGGIPCRTQSNTTISCIKTNVTEALEFQANQEKLYTNLQIVCMSMTQPVEVLNSSVFYPQNKKLVSLELWECNIQLVSNAFENFKVLEVLTFKECALKGTDLATFNSSQSEYTYLPKLKRLSLAINAIKNVDLPSDIFYGFPDDVELDLSLNRINEFTTVIHTRLSKLDLSRNMLKSARLQTKVCHVDFSLNQIKSIKASDFSGLECTGNLTLIFSGNFLLEVERNVFAKFETIGTLTFQQIPFGKSCQNVSSLCNLLSSLENKTIQSLELVDSGLTDNDIANNNSCFASLSKTNITTLNISWNFIQLRRHDRFFEVIASITSLEELDLSANDIENQVAIRKPLENLKVLDLSKNYIPKSCNALEFSERNSITTVPKLETLRLIRAFDKSRPITENCDITWFDGLENLKTLDLTDNVLFGHITPKQYGYIFYRLRNLAHLNVSHTDLGLADINITKAYYPSKTLLTLNVSYTYLTDLHMPLIENLASLQVLDVTWNRLGRIKKDWFANLKNLTSLLVSDNKLVQVDIETFDELPRLKNLTLGNNAFGCGCDSSKLAKWLAKQKHAQTTDRKGIDIDFDKIICLVPTYGKKLVHYNPNIFQCDPGVTAAVAIAPIVGLVTLISFIVCAVYGTDIRYHIASQNSVRYKRGLPKTLRRSGSKEQLLYHIIDSDAFVCYDVEAENRWVGRLDGMLHFCDSLRVRLKYLLLPRETYASQITNTAPTCRSILLAVDRGFVPNVWVNVRTSFMNLPGEIHKRCVLVLLDGMRMNDLDEPLRSLGRKGTVLEWPHAREQGCGNRGSLDRKLDKFWKELRMTLKGFPKSTVILLCRLLGLFCCKPSARRTRSPNLSGTINTDSD